MQNYYTRRKPNKPINYEDSYWGTIVDPDGNVRNRRQERERHLDDIKQEIAFLNSLPPGRILDIGCGLGFLLSGLKQGWEKYGIELSRFAAKHATRWGKIYVGNLTDANYSDEYFDVVVMHHVIEHMEDPIEAIHEVRRILKGKGILLLGTPDFDSGCARRFGKNYRLLHDPSHISLFSNDSIQRFLRDHGFIIDRVEYPFFETRYFTQENLMRLFDATQISPPFYGNFITFYCHKPDRGVIYEAIMDLSLLTAKVADEMEEKIKKAAQLISDCFRAGGKVLACGNGDSAVNVQHFVAELGCCTKRMRQLLLINLQDLDSSGLKIWGKDDSSDCIFNFKIKKLGQPGDVLLFVSSKCCSAKPSKALKTARSRGLKSIALLSEVDLPFLKEGDVYIKIPSRNTHRVKEVHSAVLHAIYDYLEQ